MVGGRSGYTDLNDTPTASPGQLAQHIRENPLIQLNIWKPGSRLLERCSPPHPLSGYYCDALLKDLRHTSNWDPRYMDALDLTDGDHRYRLLSHVGMALAAAAEWLSCPESHNDVSTLLPWQLLWSREAASPEHHYTWFTMSPEFALAGVEGTRRVHEGGGSGGLGISRALVASAWSRAGGGRGGGCARRGTTPVYR